MTNMPRLVEMEGMAISEEAQAPGWRTSYGGKKTGPKQPQGATQHGHAAPVNRGKASRKAGKRLAAASRLPDKETQGAATEIKQLLRPPGTLTNTSRKEEISGTTRRPAPVQEPIEVRFREPKAGNSQAGPKDSTWVEKVKQRQA